MASSSGFIAGLGQIRLTLELTPQPGPSGGDILTVAILTTERNPLPIDGQTIAFYLDANEAASEPTGHDGRSVHTFIGLEFGTYAVSVQLAGVHVTQRHTFPRPTKMPIAANDVVFNIQPSHVGTRVVITTVFREKPEDRGVAVPKTPIVVSVREMDDSDTIETDDRGECVIFVPQFADNERNVRVEIRGTRIIKRRRLLPAS